MSAACFYAVLHYNGRDFAGWQRQASDRTAQGVFEAALARLSGCSITVHAAGRTDAGVHATGQVVSFQLDKPWDASDLLRALRATTPDDMWVAKVAHAPPGFHARRDATARRYRYVIGCDPSALSPFRHPYEWALGAPLDFSALQESATDVRGEHDFRAFAAVGQVKPHYRCRVTVSEWHTRAEHEGFIFTAEADRFLHHMVRFLVGTMVDVARGRRPQEDMARLLGGTSNRETSPPAPAHGLYLIGVRYPQLGEGLNR